ncbi:hypothetical protein O1L44_30900 [Streptomyces noursei]|nr:hypothetical protein [Streptomyces noursei]
MQFVRSVDTDKMDFDCGVFGRELVPHKKGTKHRRTVQDSGRRPTAYG